MVVPPVEGVTAARAIGSVFALSAVVKVHKGPLTVSPCMSLASTRHRYFDEGSRFVTTKEGDASCEAFRGGVGLVPRYTS